MRLYAGSSEEFIADSVQLMWAVKPELSHLEGKFFGEIADELKLDPVDAYLTVTSPASFNGITRIPRLTIRPAATYGTSFTSKWSDRISRS